MNAKADFIRQLKASFPGLQSQPLEDLVADNLISPFTVELPKSVLTQAQNAIQLLFSMREKSTYLAHYQSLIAEKGLRDPGNKSIMMSYDFHLDENQNLKLIEINTNAAFLLLGHEMYQSKGQKLPVADFSLAELKNCIEQELRLQGKQATPNLKVAIIDEDPEQQRLFVEFLACNELFKSWGWDSRIQDYKDVFKSSHPDFIYNRYTDFFLEQDSSAALRKKFLEREVCLSPNPFEYLLLADKQRMIDWVTPGFLEAQGFQGAELELLRQCLPLSLDLNPAHADEIWSQRKKLFFKPKNAFGSKQSFRGGTISRNAFTELLNTNTIAQEFVPAPELPFTTPEGPQKFKFDLRCYAYQGRLQLVVARLYQGQVTNLRTPHGGFATVQFQ